MTTADTVSTVVPSPWPDLDIPDVPLTAFLLARGRAQARPPRRGGRRDRPLADLRRLRPPDRASRGGFAAEGLGKGDVVAILSPNSPEWLVACHGAIAAGGVVSGLNPLWSADEVAAQIHDSAARFLVTIGPLAATARAAAEKAGVGTRLVLLDGQAPRGHHGALGSPTCSPAPTRPRTSRSTRRSTSRCCPTPAAPPACPRA